MKYFLGNEGHRIPIKKISLKDLFEIIHIVFIYDKSNDAISKLKKKVFRQIKKNRRKL